MQPLKKTQFETATTPEINHIFAVICLTSTDIQRYFNFGYKDMDESCGPYKYDCPKSILDLLDPTDNEWANNWRKTCYENYEKKHSSNSLSKLPIGSVIEWTCQHEMTSGHKPGDKIKLTKRKGWKQSYWSDGYYKYRTGLINDYTVISKGE